MSERTGPLRAQSTLLQHSSDPRSVLPIGTKKQMIRKDACIDKLTNAMHILKLTYTPHPSTPAHYSSSPHDCTTGAALASSIHCRMDASSWRRTVATEGGS